MVESSNNYVKVAGAEPSRGEAMKELAKFSIMPILGAMMMPFFSILNTGVCGYLGDPNYLAGYGLGSLTIAIFATSTLVQLSSIQTLVGHANGA